MRKQGVLRVAAVGVVCLCLGVPGWAAAKGPKPTPTPVPADPHIAFASSDAQGHRVSVCNSDGQRATVVYTDPANAVHPSLSPFRDAVAFIATAGTPGSKLMTADFTVVNGDVVAGSARVLYQSSQGGSYPAWSPDGTRISFVDWDANGNYFIEVMPAGGLQPGEMPTRLYTAPHPLALNQPEWSRTGDRLYFSEHNEDVPGSFVVKALNLDADGNPVGSEVILSDPRFGNDLREVSVAFAQSSLAFTSGGYVFILDLDTGEVTPLCGGIEPAWSPDDSKILMSNRPKGKFVLQTITLATGQIVTIGAGRDPDWK